MKIHNLYIIYLCIYKYVYIYIYLRVYIYIYIIFKCDLVIRLIWKRFIYVQILYHLQPSYQPNGEWPTPPPYQPDDFCFESGERGCVSHPNDWCWKPGITGKHLNSGKNMEISHTIFINIQFLDWRSAWNLRTSWVESNIHGLISWSWLFQFMLSFNISTYTYLEMAIQGHPTPCWRCHHDALFTSKGGFYWFPAIFTE